MNNGATVSLISVFCVSIISNCCQHSAHSFLKATKSSRGSLLIASRFAGAISCKVLRVSGRLAKEMIKHPCVSSLCAAGILISVPRVRSAVISAGYQGAAKLGSSVAGWILQPISSYFFGGITSSLEQANQVLEDHTGRLNTIQNGVQLLQNQLHSVGLSHGQGLADVKSECLQISESLADLRKQLDELQASVNLLDEVSQQRSLQFADDMRRYIDEQEKALEQQIADVQRDIIKLSGIPEKLAVIEECQTLQCGKLNEILAQMALLVQIINESSGAGKSNNSKNLVFGKS